MKRDNLFIYLGTVIFFVLAIALGIVMYMMSNTSDKLKGETEQSIVDNQSQDTESVSTEVGKTVEEQTESNSEENNLEDFEDMSNANLSTSKEKDTTAVQENKVDKTVEKTDTSTKTEEDTSTNNEVTETKKEITFVKPTDGEIICEYAKDNLIYSDTLKEWITHTAIDIKADKTSVIKASADGIVKSIINDPRYGLTVIIEHDEGYETVYSNLLTAEFVVEGEEVTQGQTIGTAGNTAAFESNMESHLHFELLKDGEYLDPTIYLK